MDWQHLINIGAGATLGVMGWFARQLWDAVQNLKDDMSRLELHLSNNYMKAQDIRQMFNRIEVQLDKILDKVDQKADK
jgi:Zn-dependent M32 family carboxypeptidase